MEKGAFSKRSHQKEGSMMIGRRIPVLAATAVGLYAITAMPVPAVAQDAQQAQQEAQEAQQEAQQAQQEAQEAQQEAQQALAEARQALERAQQAQEQAQQAARQAQEQAQQAAQREIELARAETERETERDVERRAERDTETERDVERAQRDTDTERDIEQAAAEPAEPIEEIEIVAPRTVRATRPFGRGEQVSMSARVVVRDLDLSQTGDVQQLEDRISDAAHDICEQLATMYPMGDPEPDVCARQAINQAMAQARPAIDAAGRQ
jgi:UrcA family protein